MGSGAPAPAGWQLLVGVCVWLALHPCSHPDLRTHHLPDVQARGPHPLQ